MILEQVLAEAHSLDLLIDEFEVTGDKKARERLLQRGLRIAVRGTEVLQEEPFVTDPRRYLEERYEGLEHNPWALMEELRHDSAALKLFLSAECRLLADIGLSPAAVARTRAALAEALTEGEMNPEGFRDVMTSLVQALTQDLERVADDSRHRQIWRRLCGVLEVLCGAAVIGADALVGAAAAPATAGVSIVGAAVSQAAGTEVVARGSRRALDDN
jgi:hypothetical protein